MGKEIAKTIGSLALVAASYAALYYASIAATGQLLNVAEDVVQRFKK